MWCRLGSKQIFPSFILMKQPEFWGNNRAKISFPKCSYDKIVSPPLHLQGKKSSHGTGCWVSRPSAWRLQQHGYLAWKNALNEMNHSIDSNGSKWSTGWVIFRIWSKDVEQQIHVYGVCWQPNKEFVTGELTACNPRHILCHIRATPLKSKAVNGFKERFAGFVDSKSLTENIWFLWEELNGLEELQWIFFQFYVLGPR